MGSINPCRDDPIQHENIFTHKKTQYTMYVPTGHSLSMPMLNWVLITYTPLEEKFKYNMPLSYLLVNSPGVYGLK